MGGGNTTTTTQESGLKNPAMDAAATTIGNQLNSALQGGVKPYTGSMVPGLSSQTQAGIGSIMSAAGNTAGLNAANMWATGTIGSGGYNPALSGAQANFQSQIASGGYNPAMTRAQQGMQSYVDAASANNPAFLAQKQQLIDDVTANTNAAFSASGRFGGGSNVDSLAQGLSSGLIGLESDRQNRLLTGSNALAGIGQTAYGNMANANAGLAGVGQTAMGNAAGAAGMAPGLMQAGLVPGQAMLAAGQIADANAAAKAQDDARIWDAVNNAPWNTLQRGGSIFAGTAPVSGTTGTTTQTTQTPWWQTGLGIGAGLLSFL